MAEDVICKQWAGQQIGLSPQETVNQNTAAGAVVGTVIGAGPEQPLAPRRGYGRWCSNRRREWTSCRSFLRRQFRSGLWLRGTTSVRYCIYAMHVCQREPHSRSRNTHSSGSTIPPPPPGSGLSRRTILRRRSHALGWGSNPLPAANQMADCLARAVSIRDADSRICFLQDSAHPFSNIECLGVPCIIILTPGCHLVVFCMKVCTSQTSIGIIYLKLKPMTAKIPHSCGTGWLIPNAFGTLPAQQIFDIRSALFPFDLFFPLHCR